MDSKMSANHKFVLAILLIALAVVLSAMYASGLIAVFISVLILVLVYILRPLVMPAGYGANKIRTLSILGALGLAASWGAWAETVNIFLSAAWDAPQLSNVPIWVKNIRFSAQPSIFVLVFVFGVIFVVNYFMRDKSISGGHPTPLEIDFPEDSFQRKLEAFCAALHQDLVTIDRASNWSPEYYTELQAEVEVLSASGVTSRRKIVHLQEAIKKDRKSRSFLILGVPGSGKSVALRKLARDMLLEATRTNRVPIYINLREWIPVGPSNGGRTKFDLHDLEEFVVENVKRRGDVFTEEFVDLYFRSLWRSGRLFFIFDSFDEISELLDADENSDIIDSLSNVISRFISTHPASRGVLSSRVFRRPTQSFLAQKVLEIRPLSESSISEALSRFPQFDSRLRLSLFRDRLDLIPLARNPFIMALLGAWVKVNKELPTSQAQIYEGYIKNRLSACASRLKIANVSIEEVMDVSTEVAWFVFSSSTFGIEAPVKVISEHFNSRKVDAILEILDYARIARVTPGDDKSFAFVHRRFLEYFVTVRLLSNPNEVPVSHIPTDSRGRDALVLYAQLCEEIEAKRLADLCWREIQDNFDSPGLRLRAIHCLRFLIDAFCSRRSVILPFEDELSKFVMEHVSKGESLILAKICLETTGLLSESKAAPILTVAIVGSDSWLQETAFRSCRHLPKMEESLEGSISDYVLNISDANFWSNRENVQLSLSLSDALRNVYRASRIRLANIKLSMAAVIVALFVAPKLIFVTFIYAMLSGAMFRFVDPREIVFAVLKLSKGWAERVEKLKAHDPLRGKDFLDVSITMFRLFGAAALIIVAVAGFFSDSEKVDKIICLYGGCENYRLEMVVSFFILGLMFIDWVSMFVLVRALIRIFARSLAVVAIPVLVGGGGLFVVMLISMFYLFEFLSKYEVVFFILKVLFGIGVAFSGFFVVKEAVFKMYRCAKDFLRIKRLQLDGEISRPEVSAFFLNLLTDYGRLRFVRMLEVERVSVVGEWPSTFKLSVGRGEPVSALARLEERWLMLDR